MLTETVKDVFGIVRDTIDGQPAALNVEEISAVSSVSGGTAERLRFPVWITSKWKNC